MVSTQALDFYPGFFCHIVFFSGGGFPHVFPQNSFSNIFRSQKGPPLFAQIAQKSQVMEDAGESQLGWLGVEVENSILRGIGACDHFTRLM